MSREITGRINFKKQCLLYVYSQLKALRIYPYIEIVTKGTQN